MASPDRSSGLRALLCCIAALWLLLLGAEIARPCFFLHDDSATSFIGMYVHDFRVLTETGRLAEIDYYQYGGEPFLEQGQTGVLYPPVYLGVALAKWISGDVRWTIEWLAAGHLTFGLIGFYRWLRHGGVSPWIAALSGLAWVTCPFVLIFGSSWITVSYLAAWLPWLFWALDRLLARPSIHSSIFLGSFLGFFFLQGYVQWVVYSVLFLGLYLLLRFFDRTVLRRVAVIYHLLLAALIFLVFALPLMLPMLHATGASAARGEGISMLQALFYRVQGGDLLRAQIGIFRPHLIFDASTALLFCPAMLFVPLMLIRFFQLELEFRRRLFALLFLVAAALVLSTKWHYLLSLLPVIDKFRWPLKVFVFVDFFLIAALAWSVTTWRVRTYSFQCVLVVLLAGASVSLLCHDTNFFSQAKLPTSQPPIAEGMDPMLGRTIALANVPPVERAYRYFSYGYGTFYGVPSLGGYDPLVSRDRLRFALGIDFPDVFYGPIDSAARKKLNARAVRYWIVDPASPLRAQVEALPNLKLLANEPDRLVFENLEATPIVSSNDSPPVPLPFAYKGNSILIPINSIDRLVGISLGPTDGWWHRIDHGSWQRPIDHHDRLWITTLSTQHQIEVSFFDPRFYEGLRLSGYLLLFVLVAIGLTLYRSYRSLS